MFKRFVNQKVQNDVSNPGPKLRAGSISSKKGKSVIYCFVRSHFRLHAPVFSRKKYFKQIDLSRRTKKRVVVKFTPTKNGLLKFLFDLKNQRFFGRKVIKVEITLLEDIFRSVNCSFFRFGFQKNFTTRNFIMEEKQSYTFVFAMSMRTLFNLNL